MKIEDFISGSWESGYKYRYFVPSPINHPFSWDDSIINTLLEKASMRIGELDSFSRLVPDIDMFIQMHVTKEAVASCRIEGILTSIDETLKEEKSIAPERRNDWLEVKNYVKALNFSIAELKDLPLSCRLIKKTHEVLLSSGRGGEFRTSQNWLGGASIADAVFIPPAADKLPELLSDFEKFLNNDELDIPDLVKIAVAHYQFETIHPFLDGNGRIGRLLITLFLVDKGILEKPILYLSAFFEKNRSLYYDKLAMTREKNALNQWIKYFLVGIIETAEESISTLQRILKLKEDAETSIRDMGKRSGNGFILLKSLFSAPIVSISQVQAITGTTPKTAGALVSDFVEKGILSEVTKQQRSRTFAFKSYIELFDDIR